MDGFMELTFLDFIKYDYTSLLLVCGLVVLMVTNRKNKLPAVFTLWIMTAIMIFSLFVEFVCKWSENDPSLADIRYWTTIIKYLISPTLLMMQCMVLVENKVLRGLLVIPNLISVFAVTAGPYVTGLTVLSFSKEYYFVEGPLRVFPFAVALFYLFVLVIVSLWFFFDVTSGYNSIIAVSLRPFRKIIKRTLREMIPAGRALLFYRRQNMNIIILDNHKLIISEIRRQVMSVQPNAVCECFTKQREAIEYVRNNPVDAALLDVDMPGLNGIEVAELMCQLNPRLNIIFVTGYPEYALQAFSVPVSDFIVKPVSEEALKTSFGKLRFPPEQSVDLYRYDDVKDAKALGARLRSLRKKRGLSVKELADRIDVSFQTIYRWENGERIPDGFNMGKLMNVLGVRMKDIISDIDIDLQNNSGGEQD